MSLYASNAHKPFVYVVQVKLITTYVPHPAVMKYVAILVTPSVYRIYNICVGNIAYLEHEMTWAKFRKKKERKLVWTKTRPKEFQ